MNRMWRNAVCDFLFLFFVDKEILYMHLLVA